MASLIEKTLNLIKLELKKSKTHYYTIYYPGKYTIFAIEKKTNLNYSPKINHMSYCSMWHVSKGGYKSLWIYIACGMKKLKFWRPYAVFIKINKILACYRYKVANSDIFCGFFLSALGLVI
jgi:hypothetical protein